MTKGALRGASFFCPFYEITFRGLTCMRMTALLAKYEHRAQARTTFCLQSSVHATTTPAGEPSHAVEAS